MENHVPITADLGYLYLGGTTIWMGTYIRKVGSNCLDGYLYLWGTTYACSLLKC